MALYLGRQKIAPVVDTIDVKLADATESDVLAGKTFFSGNAELKTGTLEVPDLSATTATTADVMQGKKFYNAQGEFVEGSYEASVGKVGQILDKSIVNLTLSDLQGAKSIYKNSLEQCHNLESVVMPNTVTSIGDSAFAFDESLISVIFEEGSQLTTIGGQAFRGCISLDTEIPETVTSIGSYAFYNCALKEIHISKNVTNIGSSAFSYCKQLEKITFEEGCQITSIGSGTFSDCGNYSSPIEEINLIPCVNLKSLQNFAFQYTIFKNLKLPSTITNIGSNVVSSGNLNELTILATTPPTLNAYSNLSGFKKIYIPKGTLSAYESATNWSALVSKLVELEA